MAMYLTRLVLATGVAVAVCAPGLPDVVAPASSKDAVCWCCGIGVAEPSDEQGAGSKSDWSPEAKAALDRLVEGNQRFAAGKPEHKHTSAEWRAEIAKKQQPFATILGCSDSRVAPELVFDQTLGSLFVVRVAGNVVNMDIDGSLHYAGRHLHTRLIMVLGHENCGAVAAALEAQGKTKEPPGLHQLIENLRPVFKDLDPKLPKNKRLAAAVEANVRWAMKQLTDVPEHREALDNGNVALVGAVYDLETGKVRLLK